MPPKPNKKIPRGSSLNSKTPNPYEIAYKMIWDKLPAWKQRAITEDTAAKRWDSSVMIIFTEQVNSQAEKLFAVVETIKKN